jgi:hypothetical protein
VCGMASTGGLNRRRYHVTDARGDHRICHMCQTVANGKGIPDWKARYGNMVIWDDTVTWDDIERIEAHKARKNVAVEG